MPLFTSHSAESSLSSEAIPKTSRERRHQKTICKLRIIRKNLVKLPKVHLLYLKNHTMSLYRGKSKYTPGSNRMQIATWKIRACSKHTRIKK